MLKIIVPKLVSPMWPTVTQIDIFIKYLNEMRRKDTNKSVFHRHKSVIFPFIFQSSSLSRSLFEFVIRKFTDQLLLIVFSVQVSGIRQIPD